MRSTLSALILLPALPIVLGLSLLSQDGGKQQGDTNKLPPLTRHFEAERKRLDKELLGVWKLAQIESLYDRIDSTAVGGMLSFQDGVMRLSARMTIHGVGLFGASSQDWIHSSAHSYRVDEFNQLQTASIFGFENWDTDNELEYIENDRFAQYRVLLTGDDLRLERTDGKNYTFRRYGAGKFPDKASEWLQRTGGGRVLDAEPPRTDRR